MKVKNSQKLAENLYNIIVFSSKLSLQEFRSKKASCLKKKKNMYPEAWGDTFWKQKHNNSDTNSKWLWLFSKEIDVIIAPGFTFPAPPVKHPARLVPAVSYTAAYNVLDFPVGSVPITRVIPQDEVCQYLLNYSLK